MKSKITKKLKIFIFVFVIALLNPISLYYGFLFYSHDFNPNFLKIDKCLDSGGSWDYENNECRKE